MKVGEFFLLCIACIFIISIAWISFFYLKKEFPLESNQDRIDYLMLMEQNNKLNDQLTECKLSNSIHL